MAQNSTRVSAASSTSSASSVDSNKYARWFQRVLKLGMVLNGGFILGMFIVPNLVLSLMDLSGSQVIWVQAVVMLVGVITITYVPAAIDPLEHRWSAIYSSIPRLASAVFFGAHVLLGAEKGFLNIVLFDGSFGLAQALLLYKAFQEARGGEARSTAPATA